MTRGIGHQQSLDLDPPQVPGAIGLSPRCSGLPCSSGPLWCPSRAASRLSAALQSALPPPAPGASSAAGGMAEGPGEVSVVEDMQMFPAIRPVRA